MDLQTDLRRTGGTGPKDGRIVVIIPRGEVIRNFVYSGALEEAARSTELSLLAVETPSEIDDFLRERFTDIYPLRESKEKWLVSIQRELLDVAHGRWLWSEAARERWRLRDIEAVTLRQKAIRAVKKSVSRPLANKAGLRVLGSLERKSSRVFSTHDEYVKLYKRTRPTLVFNGSHVHSHNAIPAVQAAQWLGIPTATFIFSWDNLTSQGRIYLPYDHYLVWNEDLKAQLLEMYDHIREDQVHITGTPQFDFHFRPEYYKPRDEFCHENGLDASREFVVYSTGMANHMPGEHQLIEEIADMLSELGPRSPQLLVRVYGKDLTGRFDELKARRTDIAFPDVAWERQWLTPKFEDSFALVNTLRHAALGINVASTVSLELCMFDKPVINVGYNPVNVPESELSYANYYNFDHYRPIVESGAVEVAHDRSEMAGMLRSAFADPGRLSTQRAALIRSMFGETLDGRSSSRVASVLVRLAGKDFSLKSGTIK